MPLTIKLITQNMFSKNGVGILILVLSLLGVEVAESQAVEAVSAIGTLVSLALMVWNQVQRKDVSNFLFKK
jgi:hypothetical protein